MSAPNQTVPFYVFTGLDKNTKELVIQGVLGRYKIKELKKFIDNFYSNIFIKSRKNILVGKRQGIIFTIEKYRHLFCMNDNRPSTKQGIANEVLNIDHSTYIYNVNQFKIKIEQNISLDLYCMEMLEQIMFETELLKTFNNLKSN